jgi:hypothetical protein
MHIKITERYPIILARTAIIKITKDNIVNDVEKTATLVHYW